MTKSQADYVTRVKEILQDEEGIITDPQIKTNLIGTVATYQTRRPNYDVEEVSGDSSTYDHDLPTNWEAGFSWIDVIEYPVKETGKPQFLPRSSYSMLRTTAGIKIRTYSPFATGRTARIVYTKKHLLNDSDVTVPDSDFEAVSILTAAKCCSQLARYYAQTARATIGADVVDYWERATHYSTQKENLEKEFGILIPDEGGAIGEWDLSPRVDRNFIFDRKRNE